MGIATLTFTILNLVSYTALVYVVFACFFYSPPSTPFEEVEAHLWTPETAPTLDKVQRFACVVNYNKDESAMALYRQLPAIIIDNSKNLTRLPGIIRNPFRHRLSRGHLSRDWNNCVLALCPGGIESCPPHVCLIQSDVKLVANYTEQLEKIFTLDFYTSGTGDAFVCLSRKALSTIGLFDENFFFLHLHEMDYFNRALYFRDQLSISINDPLHHRLYNQTFEIVANIRDTGYFRGERTLGDLPIFTRYLERKCKSAEFRPCRTSDKLRHYWFFGLELDKFGDVQDIFFAS